MRKHILKLFAFFLAATMLMCVGCADNERAEAPKLTIGIMPDVDSIPFVIAEEKGYFAKEGANVELVLFKSALDRDSSMQSGNLDGAISDVLAVCFARDGGFDVTITSSTDGSYNLVTNESGATSVSDLRGKDIAISKNTIIEYVTDRMLAAENLTENDVNKVIVPQIPVRLEMLQNGKTAAATLPEPMASVAVANGCTLAASSGELGINPGIIMVTKNAAGTKKDSLLAMYRAYNAAVAYLNEAPREEYIDLVTEKTGFPPAAKESLVLPKYHEASLPTKEDVASAALWLREKGLVREGCDYDDIVIDIFSK